MNEVREAVAALRGEVSIYDSSLILEIGEWETHRRLCWRVLRVDAGKLSAEEQVAIRRDACKAATERSRILRLLGLGGPATSDGTMWHGTKLSLPDNGRRSIIELAAKDDPHAVQRVPASPAGQSGVQGGGGNA